MKSTLTMAFWITIAATTLFLALLPNHGVVHQGPWGTAGVGLIGLGMCLDARKRFLYETLRGK